MIISFPRRSAFEAPLDPAAIRPGWSGVTLFPQLKLATAARSTASSAAAI
jgi:hypothetical protein